MGDRPVEVGHDRDRELEREELGRVVLLARRAHRGDDRPGRLVADELDAGERGRERRGRNAGAIGRVDEERLRRVAHARPLGLRVDDDPLRHLEVGRRVDVDVAVPVAVDDVGDRRSLQHERDQRRPAAGDQAVDDPAQPDELLDASPVRGVLDEQDRVRREPGLLDPRPQRRRDREVRVDRPRRSPQQAALPDFRQSAAASEVTFGRFS